MSSLPATLGQYEIIREIARSNDIVYEAFDPVMHRRVAIKELNLPPGMTTAQAEERERRFRREAQAAGTLNHRNIMTVYALSADAGRIFMALEFLDGETLRALVDREAPLAAERSVALVGDVLKGLAHAHSHHVIHRDIKPDNVQILSDGVVKITDFGIARLKTQENLTIDGQVFGTPSYMSPEQIRGQDLDHRSDLFSVGVMLYEMLAGVKPFVGDSVIAITHAILNGTPVPPGGVAGPLWTVLAKSLEKMPSARYQSAREMLDALEGAIRAPYAPPPIVVPTAPAPQSVVYDPYAGTPNAAGGVPPPSPYLYTQAPYVPHAGPSMPAPPLPPPGFVYPAPPRAPLMSAEQTEFLKRLIMTILLVGTFIAILIFALNQVTRYVGEQTPAVKHSTARPLPSTGSANRANSVPGTPAAPVPVATPGDSAEDRAREWIVRGDAARAAGDPVTAENDYKEATVVAPTYPHGWIRYGDLMDEQAKGIGDPRLRAICLKNASEAWLRASENTTPGADRERLRAAAASAGLEFAIHVRDSGDFSQYPAARESARLTQAYAPEGSALQQEAKLLLAELNR